MVFSPVTHVLFDMDGLLLNTEDLYTIGFQKIASRFDKHFTFDLKAKIMGQQGREFADVIIRELNLPLTVEEFLNELHGYLEELFPESSVLPGVSKLLYHLHNNNIPIGLATSSSRDTYELKVVKHQELFSLFKYKTWGSSDPEVKRGKPHPDIFFVAADKFPDKPKPEQCLVFEDSVNGVLAARAAGMQAVMVPDPRLDRGLTSEATLVLNSVDEFRPEDFGLPPYPA
ncbi:hypothetical protein JYU34_005272 [Plutella xylostella]|uniref:pseudouridine 5'-phosphatase n=2 Tax=Plutella xylostella TaxID=51655 RepID=A0A8S4EB82_PLUXY|nr:hypothetical protein JYU34_005272 [Plutella xylostella]CAG9112970.1 unnamed protein product [Plutella xylostella]